MKSSFRSIRWRLLGLLCISLLPVAVFSLFIAFQEHDKDATFARNEIQLLAHVIAGEHRNILAQSRQLLTGLTIGNDSMEDALLGPDCSRHLQRIVQIRPLYKQVALASPSGEVYCAAHPLPGDVRLADRDFFVNAVKTKSAASSSVITSRLTGTKGIVLVQPILDPHGEILSVLVAVLGLDWIGERLKEAGLPADVVATLLSAEGVILASFPSSANDGRTALDAAEFKEQIQSADEGISEGKGLDGMMRVRTYVKLQDLPGPGVYFRIGFPTSEINKAALRTLRHLLFGFIAVLLIAIVGGWLGAKALVVNPLHALTRAAASLGGGDLSARTGLAHKPDEVGELATKFDDLASRVQRTTRALRALSAGNRLILRERDENALLQAMCTVTVETGGYPFAAVRYASEGLDKPFTLMAKAGDDLGLLDFVSKLPSGESGTAGRVMRTGERCVIKDIALDELSKGWREAAIERGFCSLASFPLKIDGETIGAFTLISMQDGAFDDDELELLDEMAADLAFGVATIRFRQAFEDARRVAERAATHDLATGLPNAAAFVASVGRMIAEAGPESKAFAILVIHLARLQDVYESLGHEPGNLIVKEVAARLKSVPSLSATLSRLAQDDFAIVFSGTAMGAAEAATTIQAQFRNSVHASGVHFEIQAAVGASYFPGHGDRPDLLVSRASFAARDAARRGLPYFAYKGSPERENPKRLAMAAELRQAIEGQALALHYQPKVDARSGSLLGCEALIRWSHPTQGMISPAAFIPIAEETGLIRELTYFVVGAALRQQKQWMDAGHRIPIAVNLSARNLYDASLSERIDALFLTWGVPRELIEFEITESALMEEPDAAREAVAALRRKGSQLYIDDFGTGYSSLAYLVSLPVHALKIDRAFVIQMTKLKEARAIVVAIISMAHELGLRVIAEGVETAEELQQLADMNCDGIQGYFTGRPVTPEEFAKRIAPGKLS